MHEVPESDSEAGCICFHPSNIDCGLAAWLAAFLFKGQLHFGGHLERGDGHVVGQRV